MNNDYILLIAVFNIALTTELAFSQPRQWPPRYDSNVVTNTHYNQINQNPFYQTESYPSGWNNNYVSPNYNPYINQQHFRNREILQNYNSVPITPNFDFNPMVTTPMMPPSMMTYNPWFQGYGAMHLQKHQQLYFPMFNYLGWTY